MHACWKSPERACFLVLGKGLGICKDLGFLGLYVVIDILDFLFCLVNRSSNYVLDIPL